MPLARLLAVTAAMLIAVAAVPRSADAQNPVFTVEGVEVDVTAGSAAQARNQAIDNAHGKAFRRLLERLVPRNRVDQVPKLSPDELANYVRDFEVFDERTSDVRYLASLTFRFQPASVREFLRDNGVAFAETRSKPVVVLPVWGSGQQAVLWDGANPWRAVWAERTQQTGLVPLTVPLGDLSDIRAVNAAEALAPDEAALERIAEIHGASDVLVTQARVAGDPEAGTASMQVVSTRVGTPALERTLVDNVQQQVDEPLEGMLARAVDGVVQDIEESWKRANLLRFDEEGTLMVEAPLDGLSRWVTVRARLDGVARIASVSLDRLTRDQALLDLRYFGDVEQLRVALLQQDLVLERIEGAAAEAGGAGMRRGTDARAATDGMTGPGEPLGGVDPLARQQPSAPAWRLRAVEMPAPEPEATDESETTAGADARGSAAGRRGAASDGTQSGGDEGGATQGGVTQGGSGGVPEGAEVRQLSSPNQGAESGRDDDGAASSAAGQ